MCVLWTHVRSCSPPCASARPWADSNAYAPACIRLSHALSVACVLVRLQGISCQLRAIVLAACLLAGQERSQASHPERICGSPDQLNGSRLHAKGREHDIAKLAVF
jgi:hypothetical protein